MIRTFEELAEKQQEYSAALASKFEGKGGKRAVVFCGGTGCLSSDSAAIREKFAAIIEEKGLSDKVTVNQVGCFGFCSQGPFVKIYPVVNGRCEDPAIRDFLKSFDYYWLKSFADDLK